MQFSALNKELSNNSSLLTPAGKRSKPTQEAQESACLQLYHKAMKHQQDGQFSEAKRLYQEILDSEVMEELCALGRSSGVDGVAGEATVAQNSTITRLKYLIFKNLASIAKEQGDYSAAVDAYIEASSIDTGDITMWCQLASAAALLGNLLLARKSWEQALCCNDRYWPALEGLCTVLFALEDFYACLHAIAKGLKLEANYPRGLSYLHVIFKQCPEFFDFPFLELRLHLMKPCPSDHQKYLDEATDMSRRRRALQEVTVISDPIIPPKKLTYFTIFGLSNWLITLYRHCKENSKTVSCFGVRIDLSSATDGNLTETATSSLVSKKPPQLPQQASSALIGLPTSATAMSSGGESDTEGQLVAGSGSPKPVIGGGGGDVSEDVMETVSLPAMIMSSSQTGTTSSSGGSGDEGGGGVGGGGRRETKRKLIDALEDFAPKRRSTRMKSRRRGNPSGNPRQSCFDMLKKYIPPWLMMTELPDLVEVSPLTKPKVEVDDSLKSERLKQVGAVVDSTPVLPDSDTVKSFLACQQHNSGVISILFEFVKLMALHYDHKWAGATLPNVKSFLDIYDLLHTHISYPSPFCTSCEAQKESFKQMAMIALCFVELYVDSMLCKKSLGSSKRLSSVIIEALANSSSSQAHSNGFQECFVFVQQCAGLVGETNREKAIYSLRVHWCVGKWKAFHKDTGGIMMALVQCKSVLESSVSADSDSPNLLVVCLPNCRTDPVISLDRVLEKMEQLEQSLSFKKVHEQFASGEYSMVVDKLLPLLDEDAESASMTEFLMGSGRSQSDETPGLFLLLQSLLKLHRHHACLQSAVHAFLLLLQAESYEGTELWSVVIREVVTSIDSCLADGKEDLLNICDAKLLKRLTTCVLKTMDVVCGMNQLHSMPTCLLWKIFYVLISSEWKLANLNSRSATPTAPKFQEEPVEREHSSPPQDIVVPVPSVSLSMEVAAVGTQSSGQGPEPQHQTERLRSQLTPSPVLGLLQSGGASTAVVKSPAASSTHSSLCSVEETQSPGLASSLHFLREAHNYLGGLSWCCKDDGCFLLNSVNVLREELRMLTKHPQKQREMLMQELDQCYYCLYKYPSNVKKAKSNRILEHSAEQIPLTWESALMLIEYVHPSHMPSIDDAKSPQVTPELVALYGRIIDVIPDPDGKVLEMDDLNDFIDGCLEVLPSPETTHQHSSVISDVYYLLADEYLKSGDNHKAIRYYSSNLCYCPNWFDSWAGLALARSRIISAKLSMRGDFKSGIEKYVQKQTPPTLKCFEKAVSLNNRHCYIIEKAFASQVVNQPQLFTDDAVCSWARSAHREMLKSAENCFSQALDLEGSKHAEPWIYRMMLGKIASKFGKPSIESLQHFAKSADILRSDRAGYPPVVELAMKNHAVEAIEVHYQLHSCTLKSLLKLFSNSDMLKDERCKIERGIVDALTQAQLPPLGTAMYDGVWEWVYELVTQAEKAELMMDICGHVSNTADNKLQQEIPACPSAKAAEVSQGTMDTTGPDTGNQGYLMELPSLEMAPDDAPPAPLPLSEQSSMEHQPSRESPQETHPLGERQLPLSKTSSSSGRSSESDSPLTHASVHSQLLHQCLYGVAVCAVRCPTYFKPLYRLSSALLELGLSKQARLLLLGPLPPALVKQQEKLQPLFVLKGLKTPIFSNMWQMYAEEINRPGNFCTHARRNLNLLFEVLSSQDDTHSLLFLAQHLKNKPESARQYMRDNERVSMFKKAVVHTIKAVKVVSANTIGMSLEEVSKLKSTATSVKTLASRIDDSSIKQQAKSLDDVIRALKKTITDMEASTSQNTQEVTTQEPPDANLGVKQENTASQEGSTCPSDNSLAGVVSTTTLMTTTTIDTTFSLATVKNKTDDPVTLTVDEELYPKASIPAVTELAELSSTSTAMDTHTNVSTAPGVCAETQAGVGMEMRISTDGSNIMETTPKTDAQDFTGQEDIMPMEH